MRFVEVSGAYGRDYRSGKAALADWNAGKDFMIQSVGIGGTYINKQDADADETLSILIRYNQMRGVVAVKRGGR